MRIEEYEKLIVETSKSYTFAKINLRLDKFIKENKNNKICFLRHDIDFSPHNALKMAEIENKNNISSTYTVLLTGKYYNAFEKEIQKLLKIISSLGHEIGLHFDPSIYDINVESKLNHYIKYEKNILEQLLQQKVEMFSFHQTTDFSMSCKAEKYGDCINVYSNFFKDKVEYTSDSNGYWRFRSWEELLNQKHQFIQILTHPIWWKYKNNLPPFETIVHNCFQRYCEEIVSYTSIFDKQSSRSNISALKKKFTDMKSYNNSDLLNAYAKFPKLLQLLERPISQIDENELINISEEYLKK